RLFGTRYRIEIYVPAAQRQYGYYVLPLLVGEQIVGRFDLKADRATGRLLVQASWSEQETDSAAAADAAAVELVRMAGWLGLGETVVLPRGDLWRTLAARPGMRLGSAGEARAAEAGAADVKAADVTATELEQATR
ncbi:MAG TPA: crosslink repair DNA glycosylase YcaQ family protein, partial [Nakamurella sp.]|nr:crosslink repair DNA glycosylase YcaQ family protein [Nakamurella sp.]